jgi:plastocyanin
MGTAVDQADTPPPQRSGWTWTRLLTIATIAVVVGIALILVLSGLIPPLIVFAVLFIVGLIVMRSKPKAGVITLLVLSVLYLATSVPFIIPGLAVPASAIDFSLNVYVVVVAIVAIVSAIALLRGRDRIPTRTPRLLGSVAVVVIILGVAVSVVASVTYDTADARAGDVRLVASGIEFSDESLDADAGTVSVFVDNNDLTLHTFTIDDLDVDVDIPAGKSTRVTFEAGSGSYTYYCVPHESDMKGKLEVR